MAIQQQDGEAGKPSATGQGSAEISAKGLSRRRFAKAGIGASGVILTLQSQAGMAATVCTTPSGSLSGNLLSRHGPPPVCNGVSPGYWKMHDAPGEWPSPYLTTTLFSSFFTCSGFNKGTYGAKTTTFDHILEHQDFDVANLGMHLVATLLNIQSGRISFLTTTQLKNIWMSWQTNGYYSPSANVHWDAAAIVVYLTSTMT